jgi:hypothetical protein
MQILPDGFTVELDGESTVLKLDGRRVGFPGSGVAAAVSFAQQYDDWNLRQFMKEEISGFYRAQGGHCQKPENRGDSPV